MFSGNAKLLFYSPLDDFSLKVPFPSEVQGIYQLIVMTGLSRPFWVARI